MGRECLTGADCKFSRMENELRAVDSVLRLVGTDRRIRPNENRCLAAESLPQWGEVGGGSPVQPSKKSAGCAHHAHPAA